MNENRAGGELLKLCSMLFLLSSDKNSYYLLNVFDRLPNPLWCLHWPRWESILTGVLIVQIHEYYMISLKSHRCCGVLNLDQYDQNAMYFLYGIILFLGTFVLFLKFKIIYSKLCVCIVFVSFLEFYVFPFPSFSVSVECFPCTYFSSLLLPFLVIYDSN